MVLKKEIIRILVGLFFLIILLVPAIRCNASVTVSDADALPISNEETEIASNENAILVSGGDTEIVSDGDIKPVPDADVETVIESTEVVIPVTELDMGDCPKEIIVGTSQMISVLTIPVNATETTLSYASDNVEIASINALGRLTGHKIGTARITVSCGTIQDSFTVSVVEDASKIAVQDIEIGDIEEKINVGDKINIYAKVYPANATNATITYKSSDTQIATVNSSGEVKGIAPGKVIIEVRAGDIVKQILLTVKIATTNIRLNNTYLVLQPDDTFQIEAEVQPQGALGVIEYKSLNTDVATVSANGIITAQSCGNTAIVVSNEDLQVTVSVIVNESGQKQNAEVKSDAESDERNTFFPDRISAENCSVITTEMLKYFYEKEKVLTVIGSSYSLFLDGKKIVNFENEVLTDLIFEDQENGFSFVVNGGNNLCGKLILDISEKVTNEKYLYLYNEAKREYEKLDTEDINLLTIDTGGKYLVSSQKLPEFEVNTVIALGGVAVIILGTFIYIAVKRQYWFW